MNLARSITLALVTALCGGCAAGSRDAAPAAAAGPGGAVVELRLHRVAELLGSRGELRLRDADVDVEDRVAGRGGAALDAGRVTLDGLELARDDAGRGATARPRYRRRDDLMESVPAAGAGGAAVLAHAGSAALASGSARVQVAPWPRVLEPVPGQTRIRSEGVRVVIETPPPGTSLDVSLVAADGSATARDVGLGRWELRPEDLTGLAAGRAHILIVARTSCSACPGGAGLTARWSTDSELEIPITLF